MPFLCGIAEVQNYKEVQICRSALSQTEIVPVSATTFISFQTVWNNVAANEGRQVYAKNYYFVAWQAVLQLRRNIFYTFVARQEFWEGRFKRPVSHLTNDMCIEFLLKNPTNTFHFNFLKVQVNQHQQSRHHFVLFFERLTLACM
jgi:hypothetical protein